MRITALLLCGVLAATSVPGNGAEVTNRGAQFRVDSELVMIPLSVTDRTGHAILNLGKADFTVAEDGAAQPVASVSRWDAPVSIGVIFDASGSMGNAIRRARTTIANLFHDSDPEDEAFLIRFAGAPVLETDFVHDPASILRSLSWESAHGATALFDAIYAGLNRMARASNAHKALVIVTDGGDNHSRRSFAELRSAARERDVQVFALAIRRDLRDLDEQRGRVQLDQLANDTGGRLLVVDSDVEAQRAMAAVGELIRNQYLLCYRPLDPSHDAKWRQVRVRLRPTSRESLYKVRSKNGYYSPELLSRPGSIH